MTFSARHLPHWCPHGQNIFLTWRLHGSLPAQFHQPRKIESSGKEFARYDRALDNAGTGPLWLQEPRIAESILHSLQMARQRKMFTLHAYVLMANHVHVLLAPRASLPEITQQIKGATARSANLILGRTGTRFWQDESFDHWIRTPQEWQRIRAYIENNPVTAGLVKNPKDWPWSSASHPIE